MIRERECVIHTIGHSNLPVEHLVALLKLNAIQVVIDIRTRPFSSYVPHFNRPNVERVLMEAGIEYVFMGDTLGGYPRDPDCYVRDASKKGRTPDYSVMATKGWFRQGLEAAIKIGAHKKTALMCSEEDPGKCHRHYLVGKSLAERGIKVFHIRASGKLESPNFRDNHLGNLNQRQTGKSENDRWSRVESNPTISGSRGANLSHDIGLADDGKCEQLTLFPMEDLST